MSLFTAKLPVSVAQQNDLQKAVHKLHWQERIELIAALAQSSRPADNKTAARLAACAQVARLWLDPAKGRVSNIITRCGVRICPWCTHHRTARAKYQILEVMGKMASPRTIVLTARSNDQPLATQLKKLRDDFHKLRRNKKWKALVTSGIYTVEVTYNPRAMTWHPHVHLIIDGQFFPQPLLSSLWKQATGDSNIVWIHKIDDALSSAMELAAYIGKPPKLKEMPNDKLREYVQATAHVRMLQTFGKAKTAKTIDQDPRPAAPAPEACFTINRIKYLANRGQAQAEVLAQLIPARWPLFLPFFSREAFPIPPPGQSRPHIDVPVLDAAIFAQFELLLKARADGDLELYNAMETF